MVRLFLLFLLLTGGSTVRADTVDYFSVHIGDSLALYGYPGGEHLLQLRAASIEPLDFIRVRYTRDTPCPDCPVRISIENGSGAVLASGTGIGTGARTEIPLWPLRYVNPEPGNPPQLSVFYEETRPEGGTARLLLFRLRLE